MATTPQLPHAASLRLLQLERRIRGHDGVDGGPSLVGSGSPPLLAQPVMQQQQQQQQQNQQQQNPQLRGSARRKRATPEQRPSGLGLTAQASPGTQLQPGSVAPRQPLFNPDNKGKEDPPHQLQQQGGRCPLGGVPAQGQLELLPANDSRGAKRARNSSPVEQQPQNFSQGG